MSINVDSCVGGRDGNGACLSNQRESKQERKDLIRDTSYWGNWEKQESPRLAFWFPGSSRRTGLCFSFSASARSPSVGEVVLIKDTKKELVSLNINCYTWYCTSLQRKKKYETPWNRAANLEAEWILRQKRRLKRYMENTSCLDI